MSDLARRVVSGFGFRWTYAEVAKVYPNDRSHYRLNIRGQRANAVMADARDVLHEGDWVMALGPNPETREWLIIGYTGTAAPGEWFEGDPGEVDYTQGNGPYAGTILPLGGFDSLWRLIPGNPASLTTGAHQLTPRRAPDDATYGHLLKILLGFTDELADTYGTASVPSDRFHIRDDIGLIPPPGPYCLTAPLASTNGPGATYQTGAKLGLRAWQGAPYQVVNGNCGTPPAPVAYTVAGSGALGGDGGTFTVTLRWLASANGDIFWLRLSPLNPIHFAVEAHGTSFAVRIDTTLFGGSTLTSPTFAAKSETIRKEIRDKDGQVRVTKSFSWNETTITYTKLSGLDSRITVETRTDEEEYTFAGQAAGGSPLYSHLPFMGCTEGAIVGGWDINGTTYGFAEPAASPPLLVRRGEVFWHHHPFAGEAVVIDGATITLEDPDEADVLPSGWYYAPDHGRIERADGRSIRISGDDEGPLPGWAYGGGAPLFPNLADLGGLDEDVLEQYPTVGRIKQFLTDAGATPDDLTDPNHRLLSPTDLLTVTRGLIVPEADLSAQIDGTKRVFDLPSTADTSRIEIRLNNIALKVGRDYRFLSNTKIQIDVRAPVATSPKDRLTARYVAVT